MKYVKEYIELVRSGEYFECIEQLKLCKFVEDVFETESIYIDEEQVEKYFSYQKYFPFDLLPWERFVFVLHNCTYSMPGVLRFPYLILFVGRGTGKNGYLAFEDFCLLTPTNGVQEYHIDIFAMAEDQAKTSWMDVYNVLESAKKTMKKHFYWNLEYIKNLKTGSMFRYRTSNAKTKDGGRPGKVDFDEYHAYPNNELVDVATTGLGKKPLARRVVTSTDGDEVRGGPLDELIESCVDILDRKVPDNGKLPFICWLNNRDEVDDERHWHEANPSLRYFPHLLHQMRIEYSDYKRNPAANRSFMTKRMNRHSEVTEQNITSQESIAATNQAIPYDDLRGKPCVAGFDYASTQDMVSAGLLFRLDGKDIWITHSWLCKQSADLPRIKAPIETWASMGLLDIVDAAEIPASLPVWWIVNTAESLGSTIQRVGIDKYRYQLMSKALEDASNDSNNSQWFEPETYVRKQLTGNIKLCRPSDEMFYSPIISSKFANKVLVWGDNPLMRWATWNTKLEVSKAGNITYGKIEHHSRKTDPFKAFVEAEIVSDILDNNEDFVMNEDETSEFTDFGVFVFD